MSRRIAPASLAALAAPAAALLLAAPSTARAQVQEVVERSQQGLALPVVGVAAAEEATATSVNPAGPGFVAHPSLHYVHQQIGDGFGHGLYAAGMLGPIGPSLSVEWVSPPEPDAPRYRLTTLGLALSDGHAGSLGFSWRWWASPDPAIEAMQAWDVGLTLRPWRYLSLAGSMLGLDARLGGVRQPVRYDLGLATRLRDDTLTLAADLLADDQAHGDFRSTHVALGARLELPSGLDLSAQVRLPISGAADVPQGVAYVLSAGWNTRHAGAMLGVAARPDEPAWLVGARLSAEAYRASPGYSVIPRIDVAEAIEPKRLLWVLVEDRDPYGTLLTRLAQAADDAAVAAVVLQIGELPVGAGRVQELRAAVAALRQRKPVLAWLTGGGTRATWLASAATSVAAPPSATVTMNGAARSSLYLREGLARLGVVVEVARAGAYKSAPEPLTRDAPSPEASQVTGALLDDAVARMVADVAEGRRLPPERVRALMDTGLFTAAEAKAAGLVDEVLWPDELKGWAGRLAGRKAMASWGYDPAPPRGAQRWGLPPAVALVRLEGIIAPGKHRPEPFGDLGMAGSESVAEALGRAADDPRVRAIVLRVESPGGDAEASELVWRAVMEARKRKPVVASLGDLAASGGYMAAAGADLVVAEPSTLTGSIGVFALKPDLSGLLGKLAVHRDAQRRGEVSEVFAIDKPWTPAERAAVERLVAARYAAFIDRVAEGRKVARERIEPAADGRVWTGAQALERGLVDRLGGLEQALAAARERAGIQAGEQVELLRLDGPGLALADPPLAGADGLGRVLSALPELRTAALLGELGPVLALPPDWVEGR